jgi:hypothetical protein
VWNDKGGQRQEKTEWHRIVLWGKQAESLQEYLTKGKQIYVEGRPADASVGRQGRQQAIHDGNQADPDHAAGRWWRRRRTWRLDGSRRRSDVARQRRRAADGAHHRRRYPVLICDS